MICDVIMLTAAAENAVVRDALGRGVANYLVKPFSEADLAERLRADARFHRELAGDRALEQADIDRASRSPESSARELHRFVSQAKRS